jgi:hypothetical protein
MSLYRFSIDWQARFSVTLLLGSMYTHCHAMIQGKGGLFNALISRICIHIETSFSGNRNTFDKSIKLSGRKVFKGATILTNPRSTFYGFQVTDQLNSEGLSFITNRQRRNEGTFCASELTGIEPTQPTPKGAGYVRLDHSATGGHE